MNGNSRKLSDKTKLNAAKIKFQKKIIQKIKNVIIK